MNRNALFAVVGVVCLVLALGVAWLSRPGRPADAGDTSAILAAVERVADAQQRQDERLARLEAQRGAGGQGALAPGRRPATPIGPDGLPGNERMDPAAAEARFQAQLRALEDKLVSEPLDARWAQKQEKVVAGFLAPANLKHENLPAPASSETRCQSKMCRISMVFADAQQAEQTQGALLMGIAEGLPHAQTFVLPRADGKVELVMFASGDPKALR
jgi:hypothetical protein